MGDVRGSLPAFRKFAHRSRGEVQTCRFDRTEQAACDQYETEYRGKINMFEDVLRRSNGASFLQILQSEADSLKQYQEEVLHLSNSVLLFLRECSATSADALSEKLRQLSENYER